MSTEAFGVAATMVDEITGTSRGIRRELSRLQTQLADLTSIGDPLEKATSGVQSFYREVAAGRGAFGGASGAAEGFTRSLTDVAKKADSVGGSVTSLKDKITGFASSIQSGISSMAGGFVGQFKDMIHVAGEYDQKMTFAAAVTHATAAEADAMRAAAMKLVAVTTLTTKEAAEGFVILGNSGLTAAQAIAAIRPVANLSMAGMVNMQKAAQITTDAMRNFNLSAEDSTRITDVMMRAHVKGGTSIEKLGFALQYSQNIMGKSFGKSIEETAGTLAYFAQMGIRGSRAGTGLTQMVQSLTQPSKKLDDTLRVMGLTMKDVDFRTNSVADVFEKLAPLVKSPGQALKLFGRQAGPMFLAAMKDGTAGMRGMVAAMSDGVTAGHAADKMMETINGSMKYFEGSANTLQVALAETIKVPFMKFLKDSGDRLSDLAPIAKKLTPVMSAAFTGMTQVATAFGGAVLDSLGMGGVGQVFKLLGDNSEGARAKVNELVQGMVAKVQDYTEKAKAFVISFVGGVKEGMAVFMTATAPVRAIFGLLTDVLLPKSIEGFGSSGTAAEEWGAKLGMAVTLGTGVATLAVGAMFAKFVFGARAATLAMGPVGLAILGLGGALALLNDDLSKTDSFWKSTWQGLGDEAYKYNDVVSKTFRATISTMKSVWTEFQDWFKRKGNLDPAVSEIRSARQKELNEGTATVYRNGQAVQSRSSTAAEIAGAKKVPTREDLVNGTVDEGRFKAGDLTGTQKAAARFADIRSAAAAKAKRSAALEAVDVTPEYPNLGKPLELPAPMQDELKFGSEKKGGKGGRRRREPLFPGGARGGGGGGSGGPRDYQGEIRDLMNKQATRKAWSGGGDDDEGKGLQNQIQQIQVDRQLAEGKRRTKVAGLWGADASESLKTPQAAPDGYSIDDVAKQTTGRGRGIGIGPGRGWTSLDAIGAGSALASDDRSISKASGSSRAPITITVAAGAVVINNKGDLDAESLSDKLFPLFQRKIEELQKREGDD
jgi:TP901 family phage tail tape measure protein